MKLVWRSLLITLLIVGVLATSLYLIQDSLIFRSSKLDKGFTYEFDQPFEEHFIATPDGIEINALLFKPAGTSKGLVVYFHGNASNLSRWGRYAVDFTNLGFEVLMMDYRGYGKSTGNPSEDTMYKDADQLLQWALSRSKPERLIIYGRSLGSAVASQLAIKANPELLILETPFDELRGALPSALRPLVAIFPIRSVFPNNIHLTQVHCKKIIFHGTNDRIVPLSSALRLKPLLADGDEFVIIPNGTHRNLRTFEVYKSKIEEVLN